jgi:hypothetical protein
VTVESIGISMGGQSSPEPKLEAGHA